MAKGYPKYTPPVESERAGKVMISPQQWFTGVPSEIWSFRVGGYQVAEKWLKDRRGRVLSFEDVQHYQRTLGALSETLRIQEQIDFTMVGLGEVIPFAGRTSIEINRSGLRISRYLGISNQELRSVHLKHYKSITLSGFLNAITGQIYRISNFTDDPNYTLDWFSYENKNLSNRTPKQAIIDGNLDEVAALIDSLYDLTQSTGIEDA